MLFFNDKIKVGVIMSLSVVIPCYNEESRKGLSFSERLDLVADYLKTNISDYELILVSDGSTDYTESIIRSFAISNNNIKICCYKDNRGNGYAIKRGVCLSIKSFILIMDADLSTDLSHISSFYNLISSSNLEAVVGSRENAYKSSVRKGLSKLSHFCMKNILKLDLDDTQCGFKMCKSIILEDFVLKYQTCNNWLFDAEFLVFLKENKYRVTSEVVSWVNNEDSRVIVFSGVLTSTFELLRIFLKKSYYKRGFNL